MSPLSWFQRSFGRAGVGQFYMDYLPFEFGASMHGVPASVTFLEGALPPGLTNVGTRIEGVPAAAGVFNFKVRVTDGCTTFDTSCSITNYPELFITTSNLPCGRVGQEYFAQLQAAGGAPPYMWFDAETLPQGLTINTNGTITGVPQIAFANFIYESVGDAFGHGASASLLLTIAPAPPPTIDSPMPVANGFTFRVNGAVGQDYTLETSLNLTDWADVFTTNAPSDVFLVTDTNVVSGKRYYRLRARR